MKEWFKNWPSWIWDATKEQFTIVGKIFFSLAVIIVSYFLIKLITYLLKKAFGVKSKLEIDRSAKSFFINTIKILLWLLVAFIVVEILGLDLTSFAGILSAITVALGLALQDVISSFASGLIILNQKYFKTGDFLEIKSESGYTAEGEVKSVHLMSTELKTPSGQYISVSNASVRKAMVTNFTRNGTRRIVLEIPVSYDADSTLVKSTLKQIVETDKRVLKDPKPSVNYCDMTSLGAVVCIKCWTSTDDYWDVLNELREKVIIAFNKNHITIPKKTDINISKGN